MNIGAIVRSLVMGFLFASLSLQLVSCSAVGVTVATLGHVFKMVDDPSEKVPAKAPPEMTEEYREALTLLDTQKYENALAAFDAFLRDEPTAPYTQAAQLNAGRALEGLGRWNDASERYRKVISATERRAPRLQAAALYRLSFCHEALGDDQQSVAVLTDLLARKQNLSEEIGRAELPARLAAAYARVGNFDKALEHYRVAELGIAQLKRAGTAVSIPEWLPRTLYFMGSMSLRKVTWQDFETAIRPLARSQTYLLQAAELGAQPWSERAASDLSAVYADLWRTIESAQLQAQDRDPLLARRELQKQQWARSTLLLENLLELKARLPAEKSSQQALDIQAVVLELEKKIASLLSERPEGEGLTVEARERRKRSRARVVEPDASLERRFLESAKQNRRSQESKP